MRPARTQPGETRAVPAASRAPMRAAVDSEERPGHRTPEAVRAAQGARPSSHQRMVVLVDRLTRGGRELVESRHQLVSVPRGYLPQDPPNRVASVSIHLFDQRVAVLRQGEGDVTPVGGILTAVDHADLEQAVADATGVRRADAQSRRNGTQVHSAADRD